MLFSVPVAQVGVFAPPGRDWDVTDLWGVGQWGRGPASVTDGATFSVPVAGVAVVAFLPTVIRPTNLAVPVASVTIAGFAPTITAPVLFAPPVATVSVTAPAPVYTAPPPIYYAAPVAQVAVSSPAPTITNVPIGPFDPAHLPGLMVWLDASKLAAADGVAVPQLDDYSGWARHAAQATGTLQPLCKTGQTPSGLKVARFDGVDDYLLAAPWPWPQQHTVFVVFRANDTVPSGDGLANASNAAGPLRVLQLRQLDAVTAQGAAFNDAGTGTVNNQTSATQTWHRLSYLRTLADVNLYVDGASTGAVAVAGTAPAFTVGLYVGSANLQTKPGNVDIGEVIAYDHVLTSTERQQIEDYLNEKWLVAPGGFFQPPVAQVTVGGAAPTIQIPVVFFPAPAQVTASAPVPSYQAPIPIHADVPVAQVTVSAPLPTITAPYNVVVPVAQVTVTGPLPTITRTLLLPTAQVAVTAPTPGFTRPTDFSVPVAQVTASAFPPSLSRDIAIPLAHVSVTGIAITKTTIVYSVDCAQVYVYAWQPAVGGLDKHAIVEITGHISREARPDYALLGQFHGQFQNVLGVSTVRGRYTFSSNYTTGGETVTFPIQRVVVSALFADVAAGKGIIWTGTKLQAWNLDVNGNPTTQVAAGTDLSSVTVPMIVSVIAH